MEWLILAVGIALVLVAIVDALWTTLWVDGGSGPLSRGIMRTLRRLMSRLVGRERPHLRSLGAPAMLVATPTIWVLLLWVGWSLVFLADPQALKHSATGDLAGSGDRIYFAGYSLFTLGNGEFSPQGFGWQMTTALASATGLATITLGITYLFSVLNAQVDQRAAAALVLETAKDPVSLVLALRGDGTWPDAHSWAREMANRLSRISDQHLAYPVLHFFASGVPTKSSAVAVAALDEANLILRHGIRTGSGPSGFSLDALSAALESYAKTMESAWKLQPGPEPSPPALSRLQAEGVDVVDQAEFDRRLQALSQRRRRLVALVGSDGWTWGSLSGK